MVFVPIQPLGKSPMKPTKTGLWLQWFLNCYKEEQKENLHSEESLKCHEPKIMMNDFCIAHM